MTSPPLPAPAVEDIESCNAAYGQDILLNDCMEVVNLINTLPLGSVVIPFMISYGMRLRDRS